MSEWESIEKAERGLYLGTLLLILMIIAIFIFIMREVVG